MPGLWEWVGAFCWATNQGVYIFLKPKGKSITLYCWLKDTDTTKVILNTIFPGLTTLAKHSGAGPQSNKQLVAYKGSPTLFTSNRYRCLLSQDSGLNLLNQKRAAVTPTGQRISVIPQPNPLSSLENGNRSIRDYEPPHSDRAPTTAFTHRAVI
jgi:hypothetical protein